jgi:ornithine carbamoyltransferase
VVQVYPEKWYAKPVTSGAFRASTDLGELQNADMIVTDCWPEGGDADELNGYRITAALLDDLDRDLEFLPCPPVIRWQEVSADAMLHASCRVVEAKAFLLHAQKAVLEWAFEETRSIPGRWGSAFVRTCVNDRPDVLTA